MGAGKHYKSGHCTSPRPVPEPNSRFTFRLSQGRLRLESSFIFRPFWIIAAAVLSIALEASLEAGQALHSGPLRGGPTTHSCLQQRDRSPATSHFFHLWDPGPRESGHSAPACPVWLRTGHESFHPPGMFKVRLDDTWPSYFWVKSMLRGAMIVL